ncbi:MAG: AP2 domain-containing protein, partial [Oscillospiraceae bacterium]|nr:AP2 domain-containing protein [Oscillospiraceae bacterium]
WRCVCDCGNEKLVPAANLKNGGTKSCGCINHLSKITIGGRYGKLTVLRRVENDKKGKPVYLCLCDCDREKKYPSTWLAQGRVTSCGCSQGVTPVDLTNKRFGHVVALSPTNRRDGNAIMWKCRCDCGKLTYRSHSSLKVSGINTSCGCLQSEISTANIKKALHLVDNTCIERLQSRKPTVKSSSGVRGVYWNARDQKWRAVIGFQKKQIYLGQYDTVDEASEARKRAEKEIYEPFLEAYYREKETAAPALAAGE